MNPKFLRYYNQELQHLREVGGEFAKAFPKIAGRLGLEGFECADPYVERLLESFSFLAARIQMKVDAEYPRFTQHLAELVYPHLLAPTPSMTVVQFNPDMTNPTLGAGFVVPRQTTLNSLVPSTDFIPCIYRTGHEVRLWPVKLDEAKFFTYGGQQAGIEFQLPQNVKAGLRLRISVCNDFVFRNLAMDKLCFFIRGSDDIPMRIYEKIFSHIEGVLVTPASGARSGYKLLPKSALKTVGFDEADALIPSHRQSFQGYRLLQEYFAFPQRYMFFEVEGLRAAVQNCDERALDITILLSRGDAVLEQTLDHSYFALNCVPAINLFPHRGDRIEITSKQLEYHVVPNRSHPLDFEVFHITDVIGYGNGPESMQGFESFYCAKDLNRESQEKSYYTMRRERRLLSERQRNVGPRSSYIGSEVFVSIVDAKNTPYPPDLMQLGLGTLCTNRDLPLTMSLGIGRTDFLIMGEAPAESVRVVAGPSQPYASFAEGAMIWRFLNHLSLNYLSLMDSDPQQGAVALRELLYLYSHENDDASHRQVEGVRNVQCDRITRRMPSPGPITYGRGLQLTLTMDDNAFEGSGPFLLGAVLDRFFAQYVSVNSFTETVIKTIGRGEIMRWPSKAGLCAIL
ncbi:type VI secretion system baseplate subunit TssF [Massilia sp. W12]|uniref:type VI secretion system baseplate subunit TssF n=1 Tax=Massilia sp. W12 TaxID=3126507 RepID=UPI0030D20FC5